MLSPVNLSLITTHGKTLVASTDPVRITTPQGKWQYAVSFPYVGDGNPCVVELEAEILKGIIGFGFVDNDLSTYVSGEAVLDQARGRTVVRIGLLDPSRAAHLVVRNFDPSGTRSSCTIFKASGVPVTDADRREFKRLRCEQFGYWHYSYDLGDGVTAAATISGSMDYHVLNQSILINLMESEFGNLSGLRVLDAGGASGFHSFALAQKGAVVTAIDINSLHIVQAKFVQSCLADSPAKSIHFQRCDLFEFQSEPFEIVCCSGLIGHIHDPVGGLAKLRSLCKIGAVIQCHVAGWDGDFMEFADHKKFVCCNENEFAFIPSADILLKIFKRIGFSSTRLIRPLEVVPEAGLAKLLPHYADLVRNKSAYYVLRP